MNPSSSKSFGHLCEHYTQRDGPNFRMENCPCRRQNISPGDTMLIWNGYQENFLGLCVVQKLGPGPYDVFVQIISLDRIYVNLIDNNGECDGPTVCSSIKNCVARNWMYTMHICNLHQPSGHDALVSAAFVNVTDVNWAPPPEKIFYNFNLEVFINANN